MESNLTPEQLDSIIDRLESNKENIPETAVMDTATGEILDEGTMLASVDSETGATILDFTKEQTKEASESFKDIFGASDEDILSLIAIVKRYKAGEKFNVYNALPDCFQRAVQNVTFAAGGDKSKLNAVAKEFILDQFVASSEMNTAFDEFNKEMEDVYKGIPSMGDMYSDMLYESMVTKMRENAEKVKEEHPEVAEKMNRVANIFEDTCTFSTVKKLIRGRAFCMNIYRIIKKDRFDSEMKTFNYLLSKHITFKWPDVTSIIGIMKRVLPEAREVDIKGFILTFYFHAISLNLDDPFDAEYVYYTLRNIIALDFAEGNSEFNKKLIEDMAECVTIVKNVYELK